MRTFEFTILFIWYPYFTPQTRYTIRDWLFLSNRDERNNIFILHSQRKYNEIFELRRKKIPFFFQTFFFFYR